MHGLISGIPINWASMASRKEDVDLWLVLTDPNCARKFIQEYQWNTPPEWRPDKVVLDNDRTIHFKTMNDEEAVVAAMAILRDVEVPMVMRQKQLEFWEH